MTEKVAVICIGISGSGKTTWVKRFLKNNSNYIRVNRDSLRESITGTYKVDYYKNKNIKFLESLVTNITSEIYTNCVLNDIPIIDDNTNLNLERLQTLIKKLSRANYKIKFRLFDTNLEEARRKVYIRDYWGLEDDLDNVNYINKQYGQYLNVQSYLVTKYDKKDFIS